jgi:hypothetical protein
MGKEKCDCGKIATYLYMPGYSDGSNSYVCDDCISSPDDVGCSCNFHYAKGEDAEQPEGVEGKDWRWVTHEGNDYWVKMTKEDGIWINLDERGRPYACAEYMYDEDGFDELTLWEKFKYSKFIFWIRRNYLEMKWSVKAWWKKHIVDEAPNDIDL